MNSNEKNQKDYHKQTDYKNKEFIKNELYNLKEVLYDLNRKVDTHGHLEYERELEKLANENQKIMHDYKMLKNDNTEIMHSINSLSKVTE